MNSDGSYSAVSYLDPVHFKKNGTWNDINNSLSLKKDDSQGEVRTVYVPESSPLDVKLSETYGENAVSITNKDYVLSWSYSPAEDERGYESKNVTAKKKDKSYCIDEKNPNNEFTVLKNLSDGITYYDILPSVSLEYVLSSIYFKENIILNDEKAQHKFIIKYDIGKLEPKIIDKNEILLVDEGGNQIFDIYAPCMQDAGGAASENVVLEILSEKEGILKVLLTVDEEWLKDKERIYPVTIDPYIFQEVKNHESDATALYNDVTYPYGTLCVGNDNGESCGKAKGYIKFSLPALGPGDVVTGGKVALAQYTGTYGYSHVGNPSLRINAYRVEEAWSENTIKNSVGYGGLPSVNSVVAEYQSVKQESSYKWKYFDVSRTVKQWYQGTPNYGICLRADNQEAWAMARFITSDNPDFTNGEPKLEITYKNNKGLENYWSYHDIDLGDSGTAYINDYTGNLVVDTGLASTPGNNMPVNLSLIYNGYMAARDNSYVTKCGAGWNMNVQEFLQEIDQNGTSLEKKLYSAGYRYIYTDGDGTEHYLWINDKNKIVDEDGLGLTLTVLSSVNDNSEKYELESDKGDKITFKASGHLRRIYDSEGNYIHVAYSGTVANRITYVKDGAGRTINLSYDENNRVTEVTDPAGRKTVLSYLTNTSASRLSRITYPDGTYTAFAYTDGKIIKIRCTDAIRYRFDYPSSSRDVINHRVSEVTQFNSSDGGSYLAANEGGKLSMDYSKLNRTVFTDRDNRKEVYVFDNTGRTLNVFDASGGSSMYSYQSSSTKGKTSNTLKSSNQASKFVDNLFRGHSFETGLGVWISSSAEISTAEKYIGEKSVKLSSTGYVNQKISKTSGTYTVSAYVKGTSASSQVQFGVTCYNSSGTSVSSSSSNTFAVTDLWTRVSYTFTLPSGTSYFRPKVRNPGSDAIWVDCVQLEKSSVMNPYNMVISGGFENTEATAWEMINTSSDDGYENDTYYGRSAVLKGDGISEKRFYQKIQINKAAKNLHLSLSGLAYAYSVPLSGSRKFSLGIRTVFTDGTENTKYQNFNTGAGGLWQYTSNTFGYTDDDAEKTVDYIYVQCCYHDNANTAKFDHIQLNIDEAGTAYTYDSEGNLITATDNAGRKQQFTFSDANELTRVNTSDNKEYEYTYANSKPHRLLSATSKSSQIKFGFTYTAKGKISSSKVQHVDSTGTGTGKYIKNVTTYSDDGAYVTAQGNDLGKKDLRVFNADKGTMVKYKDRNGNETGYSYNSSNDSLTGISGPDNSSVQYSYNSKNYLSSVTVPEQSTFSFTYDSFGNPETVKVGNQTLITNTYEANNGNLKSKTYGNGFTESYTYDSLDRLTSVSTSGDDNKYTWVYNANGQIGKYEDNDANKTYQYSYDNIGRLTRTDISDGSWFRSRYNTVNNVTRLKYKYNGQLRNVEYEYGEDNVPVSTSFNANARVSNEYDNLRRSSKVSFVNFNADTDSYMKYGYMDWASDAERTTGIVQTIDYKTTGGRISDRYYEYDDNGNILVVRGGLTSGGDIRVKCEYDNRDRLVRYDSKRMNKSYCFTYDNNGNIKTKKEFDFTTAQSPGTPTATVEYKYETGNWKDLLTEYNGQKIDYDAIGNMTSYNGNTYAWEGRQLASVKVGDNTYSYTYSSDGIRTGKAVNASTSTAVTTDFFLNGDRILAQKTGSDVLWFFYDSEGKRIGMVKNGVSYYYLYNLTGDVIGIMRASDGIVVATYDYDAWGKCKVNNYENLTIGTENPFRFKGYYLDNETGLYYINSRYYSPEFGRFISADTTGVLGVSEDLHEKNLYAYCDNNPVTRADSSGAAWHIAIGAGVGAVAGLVGQMVSDLTTSLLNERITISNWQTYTGAILGGAGGGATLAATGNIGLFNAVTGAITTGAGATLEKITIKNYDKSWGEIALNTAIDGGVSYGLGKLPGVNKYTAGRGNQSAVYRGGLTKLRSGAASRMSSRVIGKGVKSSIVGGGALDIYYGVKQYAYNGVKKAFNTVRSWWNKWTK